MTICKRNCDSLLIQRLSDTVLYSNCRYKKQYSFRVFTDSMPRHGENIRKRKDGRWEARYAASHDHNGKTTYKSVYGNTYEEAKAKRENILNSSLKTSSRNGLTFEQVADLWLQYKKDSLKRSSYNQYYNLLHQHLLPLLINIPFSSITADDVSTLLKNKIKEGYSASTVLALRTIFIMVFHYARKHDITCSVDDEIYIPKTKRNEVKAFTRNEQKLIDEYLKEHPSVFNLSIYLSMYCGLRIGEVCALQWKDIHVNQGTIHISKTLLRMQNKMDPDIHKTEIVIQQPKTDSSIRVIPIPSFLLPILNKYKNEDDIFVITGKAHCMEPRVCLRKFKKIINQINVSDYSFHACRHTFATRCVEIGMDAKTLSEILGHSSIKTTLERYVHPSIDLKRAQMNKLENIAGSALI